MKTLLASVAVLGLAATAPANATQIIAFGQTSGSNTVTATANGTDTATSLSATSAGVNITQLLGMAPVSGAFFSLSASSIDATQTVAGAVLQHFSGSFCITAGAGCGGTNYLSGTFTDAAFGQLGGPGLVMDVSDPPDVLTLTSSVLAAATLLAPNTFDLSFSNVTPGLAIAGSTIASFGASFAGDASAGALGVAVPEPAGLGLLALGLGALGLLRRRSP